MYIFQIFDVLLRSFKHKENIMKKTLNEIYFAGGCFWGTEHFFKQIRGVVSANSGYANGHTKNPTYEEVYAEQTGYAETVKVVYDPQQICLQLLIDLFFKTIDPTSLNKQGNDIGARYRTGIYYTNLSDEVIIRKSLQKIAEKYKKPIVVECEPLQIFYEAEDWHQDYLVKTPGGYCHIPFELFTFARKANPIKLRGKKQNMKSLRKLILRREIFGK